MSSSFVRLMFSFRVLTMVVLPLPLKILLVLSSKWYFIAFLSGQPADSLRMCPSSFHLLFLSWWLTVALFLWSYTVYCSIFYVATGSHSPFSVVFYENCSVFSAHLLTHPRFCSCTKVHFSLAFRTAGFWLSVSFSNSFFRLCHYLEGE